MFKTLLSLVLALSFSLASTVAQIQVADEYEPHEPIILGCNCIIPDGAETRFLWSVSGDANSLPIEGGERLAIWAPPGEHQVTLHVTWLQFKEIELEGEKLRVLLNWDQAQYQASFSVKKKTPPEPGPEPSPPVPLESKHGFLRVAYNLCSTLSSEDKLRIVNHRLPDGNNLRTTAIHAVSLIYQEASQAMQESNPDVQEVLNQTAAKSRAALEPAAGDWPDNVFKPLGQEVNKAYLAGKINTNQEWSEVFNEIHRGFAIHKGD